MLVSLLVAAIVLSLAVLLLFRGTGEPDGWAPGPASGKGKRLRTGGRQGLAGEAAPRTCPLCGDLLEGGARVKSDLAPGKGDRIMHIYGCPRCWPSGERASVRRCPVCRAELNGNDRVYARYFERPGRHHVHVLGCDGCRGSGRA